MKVLALTLVAALIIGASSAVKLRRAEKRHSLEETSSKITEDEPITEIAEADVDRKEKEVHKRGVFHYGSLAAHTNPWPKSYAAHYGYGLHLPAVSPFAVAPLSAAHVHAPGALKYNSGFHYKTLSSPSFIHSGVSGLSSASLPALASLSPGVPHVHHAATATPFIIRPGGAVVQSYSVNYPHHKPAVSVKPVPTFASVASLQPVQPLHTFVQDVQPAHAVQHFQHEHIQPVQHYQHEHIQPVQHFQHEHIQPVQHFQHEHVQPVQHFQHEHVQPVQHFQHEHIQPVAIQPVQPVQSVVQVQHLKPFATTDLTTQQFPSYFQTFFQPAVPAISQVPAVPLTPAQPAFPAIPSFPNPPAFPTIPAVPVTPAVPVVPNVPAFPAIPTIPHNPQPQFPTNGFFPVNVQPPLPQPPQTFNFNPVAHIPGFVPVAGTPNQNRPDFGSAEAAPQIPVQPARQPNPESELPAVQPQPTQEPWKPVLYQPPAVDSDVNRPSNTLLPPYGNSASPPEGYLPPAPSSNQNLQHEFSIDSHLLDNLSDADIQNIFHQANLAAQHDHNHAHTVHTYRSRY